MSRFPRKLFAATLFAVAVVLLPVAADDKDKDKPTDWSKFAAAGSIVGEIVKADDAGLTLRLAWQSPGNAAFKGKKGGRPGQGKEQHVDYDLKPPTLKGGGPHYVIDETSGAILKKRYEQ